LQTAGSGLHGSNPINVEPQGGQQIEEILPKDMSVSMMIIPEAQKSLLWFLLNIGDCLVLSTLILVNKTYDLFP